MTGASKSSYKLPTKVLWWISGFFSALILIFVGTLLMASVVYSELPKKAELNENFHPADVIVCLTGGKGRLRTAADLFKNKFGHLLYISGIDPQVHQNEILRELGLTEANQSMNLILENKATNTIENAEEVAKFVAEKKLNRILLVTSVYHVRRSYFIFRRILPKDVHIEMTWYESEPFDESDWWKYPKGIWVTVSEFFKFFYAYVRIPQH